MQNVALQASTLSSCNRGSLRRGTQNPGLDEADLRDLKHI
jgi:hypothetical protein